MHDSLPFEISAGFAGVLEYTEDCECVDLQATSYTTVLCYNTAASDEVKSWQHGYRTFPTLNLTCDIQHPNSGQQTVVRYKDVACLYECL